MKCGLLGKKLCHSYSPKIHSMLGDYSYDLFEKSPDELAYFLKSRDWDAINVTVPYKKTVIPYLDELSPVAARLGAVNTIVRKGNKLIGHNTDYDGFRTMILTSKLDVASKKVLILGSGGSSSTVSSVLQELGAQTVIISRTGENHYGNLHLHRDAAIVVNCTPVGMFPHSEDIIIDLDTFPNLEGVLDLIYNPARTRLIMAAQQRGLVTMNGLLMLVAQAKAASQLFQGALIDDAVIQTIYNRLSRQMENIILIGMPGCGKSTIGRLLAEKLGRSFADSDTVVQEMTGIQIPEIFNKFGECAFREYETKALSILGAQSGMVIATGGGCVVKENNYPLLHQNGTIIWLKRDITKLPIEGRPLSGKNLEEMFCQRAPRYEAFADHVADNNSTPAESIAHILEVLQ